MPPVSVSFALFGTSLMPAIDLSTLFPEGVPGCNVYVGTAAPPPLFDSSGGTLVTSLPIPNDPAFIGTEMFHQLIPVDLLTGDITSTDSLRMVFGSF